MTSLHSGSLRRCLILTQTLLLAVGLSWGQGESCDTTNGGYSISIEQVATDLGTYVVGAETVDLTGFSTYRIYLDCESSQDKLNAVYGDANRPLSITSTTSFYQSALFGGTNGALANAISPALFSIYPDLEFDSWVTIGIEQQPNASNGETAVSVLEDAPFNPISVGFANGGSLIADSENGSSWFIENSDASTNGLAGADGKVLVAQLTTDGEISGQLAMQVFRNGISDDANCVRPYLGFASHGCLEATACNYTPNVLIDNGSCDFCTCPDSVQVLGAEFASDSLPQYAVELDLIADHDTTGIAALAGMKTYRLYAVLEAADDIVNAVFGNNMAPLAITSSTSFYQSALGAETPSNISPLLFDFPAYEDLQYDSWGTIGIDRSPSFMPGTGYEAVTVAGDWVAPFEAGGGIFASGVVGGTWFAFPSSSNVVPDEDLRVLIGQFTTSGVVSGTLGLQIIPANPPAGVTDYRLPFSFTSAGLSDYDYIYPEICTCENADGDYLCDSEDDCVGAYDECGICNGPGATGECGCSDIPAGDCDCDGNQLDALGVCGGTCAADADGNGTCDDSEVPGCMEVDASNYNSAATQDDGSCFYLGCTDPTASNYDAGADTDDGSCQFPGCIDPDAWNYDDTANVDDGSCQANACGVDGELVLATNYDFTPSTVSIPVGGTVVWQNNASSLHDVNGVTNSITDAPFGNPEAFSLSAVIGNEAGVCIGSYTFQVPGVYEYDCSIGIHADLGMVGSIVVGTGGCMDPAASNFSSAAEYDDGSCIYPGCMDPTACNYDLNANTDNGSCVFATGCETCSGETDGSGVIVDNDADNDGVCNANEVTGCTDPSACNYDSTPTTDTDNTLCTYVDGVCETCENGQIVDNDADNDGVCDADEIVGCQDSAACNYNAAATDPDDSCTYVDGICETCENGVIVDNDQDNDGVCDANEVTGCTDPTACNYDSTPTTDTDNTLCTYVDGVCETCENGQIVDNDTDNDGVCDADEIVGCQDSAACNYNAAATDSDDSCTYVDGVCETCENGVIVDNDQDNDGVCDANEVTGCTDPTACNYDSTPTTDTDNTLCTYVDGVCETCVDGTIVDNDQDNDGVCDANEVTGCTDPTACNYDSTPTTDTDNTLCTYVDGICETCVDGVIVDNDQDNDGVCDANEVTGCTDPTACNYDSTPTTDTDNTLCTYVDGVCETCENGVIVDNDQDNDGVCDANEVTGCTDPTACNYDSTPTTDTDNTLCTYVDGVCETCENGVIVDNDQDNDGVCDANEVTGCTDPTACNYDSTPTTDTDNTLCTYVDGICETCENGQIVDNDQDNDGVCDADETSGCTDPEACNVGSFTDTDNTLCTYVDGICETCIDGVIVDNDQDNDGVCDADETAGCTDPEACNVGSFTDTDNTLCTYVDGVCETCENGVIVDNDQDNDGVCDANEVTGCTDPTACNYDSTPTTDTDNTLCTYVDGICETCVDGVIVDNDQDDDGVCDANEVTGCTDPTACNYDSTPTTDTDNTLCTYVDGVCETCVDGVIVDNDQDNDGVCDANEVTGCTDPTACNYDSTPTTDTDNTLCTYVDGVCETCENGQIVDNDQDNDGVCDADETSGCTDPEACNVGSFTDTDNTLCTYVDGICETCIDGVIVDNDQDNDGVCDADETAGCTDPEACNVGSFTDTDNTLCTYVDGVCETCENGVIVDNDQDNDGVCDANEVTGCTDPTACNYDSTPTTDTDNTLCTYVDGICETCVDGVIVDNDQDDDGVCDANEVTGCTDPTACNYDSTPTTDTDNTLCTYVDGVCETCENGVIVDNDQDNDGVCDANEVTGCTDPTACNYDSTPTTDTDNSLCTYVDGICETCVDGTIFDNDQDNDGVCDADETSGCTDPEACNVGSFTDTDNTLCTYVDGVCETCENGQIVDNDQDNDGVCDADETAGCTDPEACNVGSFTDTDNTLCTYVDGVCETCENGVIVDNDQDNDGVCDADEIVGCQDSAACNYNAAATDSDDSCTYVDGICETCENGQIIDNDTDNDGVCDADEIVGCQDSAACNYNAAATDSDDSCTYVDGVCETCENGVIVDNDQDNDGVCDANEVTGCTDPTACNYDSTPTTDTDNTLCTYVDGVCETCVDGVIVDNDQDNDGVCDANEVTGCTDPTACNYDSTPTTDTDNTLCTYVDGVCETCENGVIVDNDQDNDGVCDADEIVGCQDSAACNYNAAATDSDDSCTYVDGVCETCENGVIVDNDADGDGICDQDEAPCHDYNSNGVCDAEEVYGCTYSGACNYSELATADDGTCTYPAAGFNCDGTSIDGSNEFAGCTYEVALNYSSAATVDNGSCLFPDMADGAGACLFEVSGDGIVNTPDLLIFLQYWETTCE